MGYQHHTRDHVSYDAWFSECADWWQGHGGEDPLDWSYLDWVRWYQEGLSVERAIARANSIVYGWPET